MININLILVFLAVTVFTFTILSFFAWMVGGDKRKVSIRLEGLSDSSLRQSDMPNIFKKDDLSTVPWLNSLLVRMQFSTYLRHQIDQAGINMRVGEVFLFMIISCFIGVLLSRTINNIIISIIMGSFFLFLPVIYVNIRKNRRLRQFEQAFPDSLDVMRSAIRAGFALHKAIQLVGNESPDPIGSEFRKTSEEVALGIPLQDALINMTERIESLDLKLFVTSVIIQRESGGNLNEILHGISSTIRARFRLKGQLRIFTAQGRMTQGILSLLPFIFGGLMYLINKDYIMILFTEKYGHYLLATALMMQIVGFIVFRKIMKIRIQ